MEGKVVTPKTGWKNGYPQKERLEEWLLQNMFEKYWKNGCSKKILEKWSLQNNGWNNGGKNVISRDFSQFS